MTLPTREANPSLRAAARALALAAAASAALLAACSSGDGAPPPANVNDNNVPAGNDNNNNGNGNGNGNDNAAFVVTDGGTPLAGWEASLHRFHFTSIVQGIAGRNVTVLVPPGYADAASASLSYPVLYMADGQNCLNTSPLSGQGWNVHVTSYDLVAKKLMAPAIVVMVDNACTNGACNTVDVRGQEYVPGYGTAPGPTADGYLDFLEQEVIPWVDATYRTVPDAAHRAIGGSSYGGIISLYAGQTRSDVFGNVMAMSPSLWAVPEFASGVTTKLPVRVYEDVGGAEPDSMVPDSAGLRDLLASKGWTLHADLEYAVGAGQQHTESSWAARLRPSLPTDPPGSSWPGALPFLFPALPDGASSPLVAWAGKIHQYALASTVTGITDRHVTVVLPPSYADPGSAARTYPVLYMHDGQNGLDWDPFGHGGWQVHRALFDLSNQGLMSEAIVVLVDKNDAARVQEYFPGAGTAPGPTADAYLDFLEQVVIPFVDGHYRTVADAAHRAIGGSSYGGLISLYGGWTRTSFETVMAMSPILLRTNPTAGQPDISYDFESLVTTQGKLPLRVYLDSGTLFYGGLFGGDDGDARTTSLTTLLTQTGWTADGASPDLIRVRAVGHNHSEDFWRRRLRPSTAADDPNTWPGALVFVFPPAN